MSEEVIRDKDLFKNCLFVGCSMIIVVFLVTTIIAYISWQQDVFDWQDDQEQRVEETK